MKYIKRFENIFRSEFPNMFEPIAEDDKPKNVPGFESGVIDPDDDDVYGEPFSDTSQMELYKTKFLKLVKERNFEETPTEIKINLHKLGQDYCMSIYNSNKHLKKFLKDELIGKYISKGFIDIMKDEGVDDVNGIIENVILVNIDNDCDSLINFKLKDMPKSEDTVCDNIIIIDKEKTTVHKYNL